MPITGLVKNMFQNNPVGAMALAGAGALAIGSAAGHIGDVFKQRYLALNEPSWKMQGEAKMYGAQGGTVAYVKGRETLYKGMFDIPYDVVKDRVQNTANSILDIPGKAVDRYRAEQAFDAIKDDPAVITLGKDKARILFREASAFAPDITRKAPHSVLPMIQSTLMTDSMSIRPEMVLNLARADGEMRRRK